jgi:hypothetical protein
LLPGTPIAFSVLLALAAPPPVGETIPIRVDFDAPTGCSSADTFYGGLLARMSRARRAMPGEDAIRLGVRLTRIGNKVRGELRMMEAGPGGGDTRRVEGETCDAVVEVLSLTAALALVARPPVTVAPPVRIALPPARSNASSSSQSSSSSSQSASSAGSDKSGKSPTPDASKPPEPEQKPPAQGEQRKNDEKEPAAIVAPPPKPPESPRGAHLEIGLQAVAADVISKSMNLGGGLAVRLERNSAEGAGASVGLSFFYASNDLLQTSDTFDANWMAVAAVACPGLSVGRSVTIQPCAQAMGGWLAASGHNLTFTYSPGRTWWSVGALLRANSRLGAGFSVELEAGASIPLVRRTFIISTPEGTVGETPTVAPMLTLGLSRSF